MTKQRNSFKYTVVKFLAWLGVATGIGLVMKMLFIILNHSIYGAYSMADYLRVLWYGLPMDLCVAAYITIIPALMLIVRQFVDGKRFKVVERGYCIAMGVILGWIFVADDMLYGYWEFKLDITPIFYFTTSPGAAMASIEWWQYIVGLLLWGVIGCGIYAAMWWGAARLKAPTALNVVSRWRRVGWLVLMTAALFLPIRGGITVSTMNLSSAYFSTDLRLNHAAVNPVFSLLYSITHTGGDLEQFTYYETNEAVRIFNEVMSANASPADTLAPLLRTDRPDVYIIILESFSAHLMPSLGGEEIAMKLDSIAGKGVLFTRHFASGFRTDRAIPAILSGYPAVPTVSVMKDVARCEKLPSIARELAKNGYTSTYYYGGDANFTNMKAYLLSAGFDRVVSDVDFPVSDRMSKWGVLDHRLMERAIADVLDERSPTFTVIQTSSSHEPFDVPYSNKKLEFDKAANAFGYTDEVVAQFVNNLRRSPRWDNALVILVPDHYAAYPHNEEDFLKRHHVPLVMTGGALAKKNRRIDVPMSQSDIAATLLGAMGLDHSAFRFSRDVMQPGAGGTAFFSSVGNAGWVTPNDTLIYEYTGGRVINDNADQSVSLPQLKAFMQILYTDFEQPELLTH